jgi:hypothetical protein
MSKVHVYGSKDHAHAACAMRSVGNGKATSNSRSTYQNMGSEIVAPAEFYRVAPADRCAHCCERVLEIANRQRANKGKDSWTSLPYYID